MKQLPLTDIIFFLGKNMIEKIKDIFRSSHDDPEKLQQEAREYWMGSEESERIQELSSLTEKLDSRTQWHG